MNETQRPSSASTDASLCAKMAPCILLCVGHEVDNGRDAHKGPLQLPRKGAKLVRRVGRRVRREVSPSLRGLHLHVYLLYDQRETVYRMTMIQTTSAAVII